MSSPLSAKTKSLQERYVGKIYLFDPFFEVAALSKPYYNPANLEKAPTGVKQKEFIERIGIALAAARLSHQ
jgi:hypothetical protein